MRTKNPISIILGVVATVVLFGAVTALAEDVNPGVAPPDSKPYGKTYGEWAAALEQWIEAIPYGVNPANDPDGSQSAINQSGSVWFLAGTFKDTTNTKGYFRSVTIPAGTAIFFPLIDYLNDYPCPEPPPFEPAPGQSLEAFLTSGAKTIINGVNQLEADLDNQLLSAYRFNSRLFSFTAAGSLSQIDSCITGSPQLGVVDGYWLFLNPPSPGKHKLHFLGALPGFKTEVTYYLTIRGERD